MAANEPNGIVLATADFSKEAMEKAVLKSVASSPLVSIPAAIGVVGIAAFAAGAMLPPVLIAALMSGLGIGGGIFALNYWGPRYETNAHNYLETIRNIQRKFVAEMPKRLEADLKAAGSDRGLEQLQQLESQFDDFQELLQRKFSNSGMTMGRLLGTA